MKKAISARKSTVIYGTFIDVSKKYVQLQPDPCNVRK